MRPGLPTELPGPVVLVDDDGDPTTPPIPTASDPVTSFAATSTRLNGVLSDNVFLYDQGFRATYTSDVWGALTQFVFDPGYHLFTRDLKVMPLVGFRYLSIQEQLRQEGKSTDIQSNAILTSIIDSDTTNYIYGPTFGFRMELEHPWFTVGVEPKIALALDSLRARVSTEQFRSFSDPTVVTEQESTIFSPVGEIELYARWHVHEHVTLHVGYSAIWAMQITRPERNIYYNDNGPNSPPAILLDTKNDDMKIHGLTFGGEIRFR